MKPFSDSELVRIPMFDLSLGVFYDRHPMSIPMGGASNCDNLIWSDGYVQTRPGLVSVYPSLDSNPVVHLSQYVPLTGESRLIRVSKTGSNVMHVHYYTQSSGWVRVTPFAGIAGALDSTNEYPPQSVNFKGSWYLCPGNTGVYEYDGTTFQLLSTGITDDLLKPFDVPRFIAASESRLFIANTMSTYSGGSRVPYRVAWCDFNRPKVWSSGSANGNGSAGFVDLPKDSEPITGIYTGPNSTLTVFKPRSIHFGVSVGSPLWFDFRLLQFGPGCISSRTIKEWRNGRILFLGDDNLYIYVPGQTPEQVGDRIRPLLQTIAGQVDMRKCRAWIDRDNDLYNLITPEYFGSKRDNVIRTFTLSLRNGSWWPGLYNIGTDSILDSCEFRSGVWEMRELVSTQQGNIYESTLSALTDAGATIPSSWVSGVIQSRTLSNNQTEQGNIQLIRAYAQSGQLQLGVYYGNQLDRLSTLCDFGVQNIDGVSELYTSERAVGENFQLYFQSQSAVTSPKLVGLVFGMKFLGNTR